MTWRCVNRTETDSSEILKEKYEVQVLKQKVEETQWLHYGQCWHKATSKADALPVRRLMPPVLLWRVSLGPGRDSQWTAASITWLWTTGSTQKPPGSQTSQVLTTCWISQGRGGRHCDSVTTPPLLVCQETWPSSPWARVPWLGHLCLWQPAPDWPPWEAGQAIPTQQRPYRDEMTYIIQCNSSFRSFSPHPEDWGGPATLQAWGRSTGSQEGPNCSLVSTSCMT